MNDEQRLSLSELNVCIRFEQTKTKRVRIFLFIKKHSDENQMNHCNSCEYDCVHIHTSWTICVCCTYFHLMYMMKESSKILFTFLLQIKMQEKTYFKCFRLFLDTWKKIQDPEMKAKYYESLLEYWLNWIKPEDPIVDALLTSAMYSIDKSDDEMKRKSESMQWNKNAQKDWWIVSKQTKTDKNSKKQNQTEKNIWRIRRIEEKEVIEEDNTTTQTNIILSDDTDAKASEYWNADINQCLNLIKMYNWWILDWTIKESRRYAKLLIDKLNKLESVQEWKFTRVQTLEIILKVISQNKFYNTKITSSESIYRNLSALMQVCKKDIQKQQGSTFILPTV